MFLLILSVNLSTGKHRELPSSLSRPTVIFRLDDVIIAGNVGYGDPSYSEDFQGDLIQEFVNRNIPITLSVIPNWKNQEVSKNNGLIRRFKKEIEAGTVEIAQHGFKHQQSGQEQTEFRSVPYPIQKEWIQKGRKMLEGVFLQTVTTFVPPWNNYDTATIRILREMGFGCLSGDLGPVGRIDKKVPHRNTDTIAYIPASCSLREVKKAVALALKSQYQSSGSHSFIVVCFHPYDFSSTAKRPIEKEELIKILDDLRYLNVNFSTLRDAAENDKGELLLARQIRAARVESLGKAAKLIPGLSNLLPDDYRFGRWMPFGIFLPEEVYASIENRLLFKTSLASLIIWIFFVEGLCLVLGRKIHVLNIAVGVLIGSIFCLSIGLYFLLLPERASIVLIGIVASGLCLVYWVSRNALGRYLIYRKGTKS